MKTTKLALGTLTALCLCLAGACDDSKKDAKDTKDGKTEAKAADAKAADAKAADAKAADAKAADAKAPEVKADEAKAPEAKPDSAAPAAVAIGVPECDDYVGKMTACIAAGTVPAGAEADAQKMGLDMSAKSWADAMKANPEGGSALVAGCKAAIDMGRLKYPTCFPQ